MLSVNVELTSIIWIHVEFQRHHALQKHQKVKLYQTFICSLQCLSPLRKLPLTPTVRPGTEKLSGTMISEAIWPSNIPTLNVALSPCSSLQLAPFHLKAQAEMRCSIQWCWKCWKWAYAFGGDDDWRRWWWWRTKEAAKNGITCLNENIITLWNWVTCHLLLHYSFCDKITDNSKLISLLSIVFSNLTEWCHPKKTANCLVLEIKLENQGMIRGMGVTSPRTW